MNIPRILVLSFLASVVLGVSATRPTVVRAEPRLSFRTATIQLPLGGAEIVAASPNGKLAVVTQSGGKTVQFLKLPKGKTKKRIDVGAIGEPTSAVFIDDRYVFIVCKDDPDNGTLVVGDAKKGRIVSQTSIGIGPDAIAVDRGRRLAVIALEDEESEVEDPTACPAENTRPGAVAIVDYSAGTGTGQMQVTTVPIDLSELPGAGCPGDPQPEYVAIDPAAGIAFVTLQENNAIAVIDLTGRTVVSVWDGGTTEHLADAMDDGVASITESLVGRREPDGVALSPDGRYLLTADEGDTGITPDGAFGGGRTMSVWDAVTGELLTDTGDAIERALVDAGFFDDGRSDRRGPEPEGIVVFVIDGMTIAAVGIERGRSVIFFDVSNPLEPVIVDVVGVGTEPEGLAWVPSTRQLLVANEISGNVTAIELTNP